VGIRSGWLADDAHHLAGGQLVGHRPRRPGNRHQLAVLVGVGHFPAIRRRRPDHPAPRPAQGHRRPRVGLGEGHHHAVLPGGHHRGPPDEAPGEQPRGVEAVARPRPVTELEALGRRHQPQPGPHRAHEGPRGVRDKGDLRPVGQQCHDRGLPDDQPGVEQAGPPRPECAAAPRARVVPAHQTKLSRPGGKRQVDFPVGEVARGRAHRVVGKAAGRGVPEQGRDRHRQHPGRSQLPCRGHLGADGGVAHGGHRPVPAISPGQGLGDGGDEGPSAASSPRKLPSSCRLPAWGTKASQPATTCR
jgi:hypothetical protein